MNNFANILVGAISMIVAIFFMAVSILMSIGTWVIGAAVGFIVLRHLVHMLF